MIGEFLSKKHFSCHRQIHQCNTPAIQEKLAVRHFGNTFKRHLLGLMESMFASIHVLVNSIISRRYFLCINLLLFLTRVC